MNKLTLDENAKEDWLKLVKKHKKKQKGLPALTTLNAYAGDVEKHIELFNKMSSPFESPSNNPISGPFGDSVTTVAEGSSMGESYTMLVKESTMNREKLTLYYPELEVEDVYTGRVFKGNEIEPDEYETTTVRDAYSYEVDKDDVLEVLGDSAEVQAKYWPDDMPSEEYENFLTTHFDELFQEFEDTLLDHFYDDAVEEARKKFNTDGYFDDEPDYDPYERMYESKIIKEELDDEFDLSLRSIL